MALIFGLYILHLLDLRLHTYILGDSQLVIKQINKEYKITKGNLFVLNYIVNRFILNKVVKAFYSLFY